MPKKAKKSKSKKIKPRRKAKRRPAKSPVEAATTVQISEDGVSVVKGTPTQAPAATPAPAAEAPATHDTPHSDMPGEMPPAANDPTQQSLGL